MVHKTGSFIMLPICWYALMNKYLVNSILLVDCSLTSVVNCAHNDIERGKCKKVYLLLLILALRAFSTFIPCSFNPFLAGMYCAL